MKKVIIIIFMLALATTACAFAGCSGGDGSSPEQVVERFLNASMDGDADTAYDQLTAADQGEIDNKEELVEGFAEGVASYDVGEANISGDTARVPLSMRIAGSEIDLEFDMILFVENGEWKISLSDTETELQKAFDELMQGYETPQ